MACRPPAHGAQLVGHACQVPRRRERPMLLVPRQLRRAGMTGDVPYYGGRFTPAQAYAAAHPRARPVAAPSPPRADQVAAPSSPRADQLAALQHLLDTGVITPEEHRRLCVRVAP